jgi:hypothetical protein
MSCLTFSFFSYLNDYFTGDLIVHRMLFAALHNESSPYVKEDVGRIAKQCNDRKFSSKDAQDASQKVYLCAYLSQLCKSMPDFVVAQNGGPGIILPALVYKVAERSFDVLVERFGIEKRVWVEDAIDSGEVLACEYNRAKHSITLHWRKLGARPSGIHVTDLDDDDVLVDDVADEDTSLERITSDVKNMSLMEFGYSAASSAVVSAWKNSSHEIEVASSSVDITKTEPAPASAVLATTFKPQKDSGANPFLQRSDKNGRRSRRAHMTSANTLSQTVALFETVFVRLTVEMSRGPPDYKLYPVYPENSSIGTMAESKYNAFMTVSVPGIIDEAD